MALFGKMVSPEDESSDAPAESPEEREKTVREDLLVARGENSLRGGDDRL